jgi:hypothetical protein
LLVGEVVETIGEAAVVLEDFVQAQDYLLLRELLTQLR